LKDKEIQVVDEVEEKEVEQEEEEKEEKEEEKKEKEEETEEDDDETFYFLISAFVFVCNYEKQKTPKCNFFIPISCIDRVYCFCGKS